MGPVLRLGDRADIIEAILFYKTPKNDDRGCSTMAIEGCSVRSFVDLTFGVISLCLGDFDRRSVAGAL